MGTDRNDAFYAEALRAILSFKGDYLFLKDVNYRNVGSSESFWAMLGAKSSAELVGKKDDELFDAALAEKYHRDDVMVMEQGKTIQGKIERLSTPDGKSFWVRTWKFPIQDNDGKIIGICGIGQDITKEIALSEQAKIDGEYHQIVESIPGGIATVHLEGKKLFLDFANRAYFRILNLTPETGKPYLGADIAPSIHPEDYPAMLEGFQKLVDGSLEEFTIEYRIVTPHRHIHWLSNQIRKGFVRDGYQYFYASGTNIDARKRAEQDMLMIRRMYDDAAAEAKLIIWNYDPAAHSVTMMSSGYTAEVCQKYHIRPVIENVPDVLLPFVEEKDRPVFQKIYSDIDSGASTSEGEFRFKLPDQKNWQWERMSFRRILDENGKLLTVHCCGMNISEQKESEERYALAYQQLDRAYPNNLGSFRLNLTKNWCGNGKSPLSFVLEQQSSGTVDGYFKEFSKLIADEEVKKDFFARFNRLRLIKDFEKGISRETIEYPIVYADGSRHWREGDLFMLKNPKTGDIEAITYAVSIDSKKRDQFIMDKMINANFDYIGLIHPATSSFEFRSRNSNIDYGEIGEQVDYEKGCDFVRAHFSDPEELAYFNEVCSLPAILADLKGKKSRSISYLWTFGGVQRCIRIQYSWLEKEGGDILVLRSDITDAYQREQNQLRQVRESLLSATKANESKSVFLSSMSHDIRTPLNGIIGFTDIALKETTLAGAQQDLKKVQTSAALLRDLVNDTLDLSRLESGKATLEETPVSIQSLAEEVITAMRPSAEMRHIAFSADVDSFPADIVMIDRLKGEKIILNLVSNAIKYTPEGGKVNVAIVPLDPPSDGNTYRFTVQDNGIGMSEDFVKNRLYEPFSQEERKETTGVMGTGLGMSIVKRIVDLMEGSISVVSVLGKGTRFTVDLPLKKAEKAQISPENSLVASFSLSGRKILLCEDNEINAEIATFLLKDKGAQVIWAKNGKEGLDLFRASGSKEYAVILMDVQMPVLDGIAATKQIRSLKRKDALEIPIIAMTGNAFEEDVKRCLDAGMNAHIAKPIDPQELFGKMASLLQK